MASCAAPPGRRCGRGGRANDGDRAEAAVCAARAMPGIRYIRVWLNRGALALGEDIMLVLVGGDIRPHVIDALQALVGELKEHCVTERETLSAAEG